MRQINPGPYPRILPTLDPPREIQEGEEIDYPDLLAGFEPVDPEEPPSAAAGDPEGGESPEPPASPEDGGDDGEPAEEPADPAPAAKTKTSRRGRGTTTDGAEEATP